MFLAGQRVLTHALNEQNIHRRHFRVVQTLFIFHNKRLYRYVVNVGWICITRRPIAMHPRATVCSVACESGSFCQTVERRIKLLAEFAANSCWIDYCRACAWCKERKNKEKQTGENKENENSTETSRREERKEEKRRAIYWGNERRNEATRSKPKKTQSRREKRRTEKKRGETRKRGKTRRNEKRKSLPDKKGNEKWEKT